MSDTAVSVTVERDLGSARVGFVDLKARGGDALLQVPGDARRRVVQRRSPHTKDGPEAGAG